MSVVFFELLVFLLLVFFCQFLKTLTNLLPPKKRRDGEQKMGTQKKKGDAKKNDEDAWMQGERNGKDRKKNVREGRKKKRCQGGTEKRYQGRDRAMNKDLREGDKNFTESPHKKTSWHGAFLLRNKSTNWYLGINVV